MIVRYSLGEKRILLHKKFHIALKPMTEKKMLSNHAVAIAKNAGIDRGKEVSRTYKMLTTNHHV